MDRLHDCLLRFLVANDTSGIIVLPRNDNAHQRTIYSKGLASYKDIGIANVTTGSGEGVLMAFAVRTPLSYHPGGKHGKTAIMVNKPEETGY